MKARTLRKVSLLCFWSWRLQSNCLSTDGNNALCSKENAASCDYRFTYESFILCLSRHQTLYFTHQDFSSPNLSWNDETVFVKTSRMVCVGSNKQTESFFIYKPAAAFCIIFRNGKGQTVYCWELMRAYDFKVESWICRSRWKPKV